MIQIIITFILGAVFGVCIIYNSISSFQDWLRTRMICEPDATRREVYREITETIKQKAWRDL
jgi:hypothetical protein